MNDTQQVSEADDATLDLAGLVRRHGRPAARLAIASAAVVGLGALIYLFLQPVSRIAILEFRPTFRGASQGEYPNSLPFGNNDVVAAPVVDSVYDSNSLADFCSREAFRGGFFVEKRSDRSAFLDSDYQARLSDTRLTSVERERIQAEYEAKREALPTQFRLVFVKPPSCSAVPDAIVRKVMADVLATWAEQSETQRGVLNHQVEVLTPAIMDVGETEEASLLLRADLIRTALWNVVANIEKVTKIPGAALVRLKPAGTTFAEVRNKVLDLVRARLEPLVASAGQSMVSQSTLWVSEAVASSEREQQAAEGRANAYLSALREYSGMAQTAQANRATAPAGGQASDVQTIWPQFDRTFIDRIVEMSQGNTVFRQELTESMIEATVASVEARDRASYYRRLQQALREPEGAQLTPAEVDARLDQIVTQAKTLVMDFTTLYEEFSRVSFRPAAAMYQTDKPVTTQASRDFSFAELTLLVFGIFVVTLLAAFGFFILRERLRGSPPTSP